MKICCIQNFNLKEMSGLVCFYERSCAPTFVKTVSNTFISIYHPSCLQNAAVNEENYFSNCQNENIEKVFGFINQPFQFSLITENIRKIPKTQAWKRRGNEGLGWK